MCQIKYILVDDSAAQGSPFGSHHRHFAHVGHFSIVSCGKLSYLADKEHQALLDKLVRLRQHHPNAPILGLSELDTSSTYAPVRVNQEMNTLRRELSDLN